MGNEVFGQFRNRFATKHGMVPNTAAIAIT